MPLSLSEMCQSIAPSITLSIDAKAKEMKRQGLDVIGFGAGEPDYDTPAAIREAAKEALDQGMTRYTPSEGTLALRQAICDKLLRDNGLRYTPSEIIVSNGAKHSLFTVFAAILNPGDEVLIPSPCWVSYPEMVRMAGGVPVYVHTDEHTNFVPTREALLEKITDRTKALIITSPSNPNGCVWSLDELQMAADLAVKKGFYVVSDEIYEKLLYDGRKHISIASLGEEIKAQTFVVNGVSKAYAMTGWRIGYAAGPKNAIAAMVGFQSHATSNPNSIAQHAALKALTGDQGCVTEMAAAFEKRRDFMVERINQIPGLSCVKPAGAFYVMLNIRAILGKRFQGQVIQGSMDFAHLLLTQKNVAVVPGIAFEADGFCRLSYAIGLEAIAEGLNRIAQFVGELE